MAKKTPSVLIGPITAAISAVGLMIGIWALLQSYKSDTGAQIASIESHFDSRITALEQRMTSLEAVMESVEFKLGELTGLIQAYHGGVGANERVAWRTPSNTASMPVVTSPATPIVAVQAVPEPMQALALEQGSAGP